MTEEANQIVANLEGLIDRRSIVIYNEDWHKGVIGICSFATYRDLLPSRRGVDPYGQHGHRIGTFRFGFRCVQSH